LSKLVVAAAAIIVVLAVAFGVYFIATYPKDTLNVLVSFTVGANEANR
jgi:hypothetical protein